jgi:hypothetical protein
MRAAGSGAAARSATSIERCADDACASFVHLVQPMAAFKAAAPLLYAVAASKQKSADVVRFCLHLM